MKSDDIDALARLLDGDLASGEAPAEARALGAFAKALEGSAATPEFSGKADLRAVLLEAAREQAATPTLLGRMRGTFDNATARWRYSMRLAAATGASAMALSTGGVAVAAQQATPGHPLYGVKLVLEEGQLWFLGDAAERGEQRLANAIERLEEARVAAAAGDMAGAARALRESDESSRRGAGDIIGAAQEQGDPSLLDVLTAFSEEQRDRLRDLQPLLAGPAAQAADDALVALNRIDQRVAVLGGACGACEEPAQSGNGKGKGKGGNNGGEDAAAATAPVDARDFDFTDIPPADEPFSPCPCATTPTGATGGTGTVDDPEDEVDQGEDKPDRKPPKDEKPDDDGKPDDDDKPGDEEPEGPLPEPVGEVTEEASEIVDEVIDQLPTDPPDVPDTPDLPPIPPPPTDGVEIPAPPKLP